MPSGKILSRKDANSTFLDNVMERPQATIHGNAKKFSHIIILCEIYPKLPLFMGKFSFSRIFYGKKSYGKFFSVPVNCSRNKLVYAVHNEPTVTAVGFEADASC